MLVLPVATLLLLIGTLVDIITRDNWQVKHLPKFAWILLVILLPIIGSILWFLIGREYGRPLGTIVSEAVRSAADSPKPAPGGRSAPRSTEEELAEVEREIAFHEKQAQIKRLEAELEERRKQQ